MSAGSGAVRLEDFGDFMGVKDVAALTGLGENTIRDLVAAGDIHSIRPRGVRRIIIPKRSLEKWLYGPETEQAGR
jgi:excisionase family DNA binding protein